jgi:hypothetical protein
VVLICCRQIARRISRFIIMIIIIVIVVNTEDRGILLNAANIIYICIYAETHTQTCLHTDK